jgi:hypothetical protein
MSVMALTATKLFRRREITRSANKRHSAGDFIMKEARHTRPNERAPTRGPGGAVRGLGNGLLFCSIGCCKVLELHYGGFTVLTSRTFEGSGLETRFFRLDARQVHSRRVRRAFWTMWSRNNWRGFERVFGKRHLRLLQLEAGVLRGNVSPIPVPPCSLFSPIVSGVTEPG